MMETSTSSQVAQASSSECLTPSQYQNAHDQSTAVTDLHEPYYPDDDNEPRLTQVYVQAANKYQENLMPQIHALRKMDIRKLWYGWLVYVSVDNPGDQPIPIQDRKISIDALCSLSLRIKSAVDENGPREIPDDIILPEGDLEAYRLIFQWIEDVLDQGSLTPMPQLTDKPLTMCYKIIDISKKLGIYPLTTKMQKTLDNLQLVNAEAWAIPTEDVREIYRNPTGGPGYEELREWVVSVVAMVYKRDPSKRSQQLKKEDQALSELLDELQDLKDDVQKRLVSLGVDPI